MSLLLRNSLFIAALLGAVACTGPAGDDPLDDESGSFGDGKADSLSDGSVEARAVLALVNDRSVTAEELDVKAKLHKTAAHNIVDHRNGADLSPETTDDNPFDDLAELDSVPFVGPVALQQLLEYAVKTGRLSAHNVSAVFSPQPLEFSHTARIAELIDGAENSIDIAMYSFSSASVSTALEKAVARGVKVRFVFETANAKDKKLTGSDLEKSKSGRLEIAGVDVRFVNKIMHHKFMIVDGPVTDLAAAETAHIASGSANWSTGGATIYDENTVFVTGSAKLALSLQREFNLMWNHSKDLSLTTAEPAEPSLTITDAEIPNDESVGLIVTSDNFTVSPGSTTFRTDKSLMTAADAWVEAIENAQTSIRVASGHLRLRPVAEALIAKRKADPNIDIRVYLDGQEYISAFGHTSQLEDREECVANATTDSKLFDCQNKSFLYGKQIHDEGVETRFKYYAYRWNFSYAIQMHHKFMIIDDNELYTGSFNLSINAEHGTFENVMRFSGDKYQDLVASYVDTFEKLWDTGRPDDLLSDLRAEIETAQNIPLVFEPIALTWNEVASLKSLIFDNCSQVNSDEFRSSPADHQVCPR